MCNRSFAISTKFTSVPSLFWTAELSILLRSECENLLAVAKI